MDEKRKGRLRFLFLVQSRLSSGEYVGRSYYEYRGCLIEVGRNRNKGFRDSGWGAWITLPDGTQKVMESTWTTADHAVPWCCWWIDEHESNLRTTHVAVGERARKRYVQQLING